MSSKTFTGKLNIYELIGLYLYYSIICFLSIVICILTISSNNINLSLFPQQLDYFLYGDSKSTLNLYNLALIGSISASLLGSSITYIKKLYVFSLGNKFDLNISNEKDTLNKLGTIVYFLFRPVFAIIFSIISYLGLIVGIIPLVNNSSDTSMLVYMYMFISFFIGFGAGNVLTSLEKNCDYIIKNTIESLKKTTA